MSKLRLFLPIGRMFLASEMFAGAGSTGVLSALDASRMAILVSKSLFADEKAMLSFKRATRRTVSLIVTVPRGEPTLDGITSALAEVNAFRPDWIVAAGGGAILDAAKLIWALYEHPALTPEQLTRPHALPPLRGKAKFAALPTTAGSGSEVSSTATFQFDRQARKSFAVSHEFVADVAILDPVLMRGTPRAVLAAAALDALAHAVEGYVSRLANPVASALAVTAARSILATAEKATAEPEDFKTRTDLMTAASLAGAVQNFAVPGIAHAVAHQLAAHEIGHAVATGALLGPSILTNCAASPEAAARYQNLAGEIGFADSDTLAERISRLAEDLGVTAALRAKLATVDASDSEFSAGVMADPCAKANPVPVDESLVTALLQGLA